MNFPTITRYNWMCCSIILVFLALSSPKPLQAQENQKERISFLYFSFFYSLPILNLY